MHSEVPPLKQVPHVSQAEWEVMKMLWDKAPMSLGELLTAVAQASEWHPNTIKTFVRRLVQKGAVGTVGSPGSYQYVPLFTREEGTRAENRSFLDRIYGGSLKPMLVAFLRDEDLTPDDIDELKDVLDGRN